MADKTEVRSAEEYLPSPLPCEREVIAESLKTEKNERTWKALAISLAIGGLLALLFSGVSRTFGP